jgi:hypothetical protein
MVKQRGKDYGVIVRRMAIPKGYRCSAGRA